MKQYVGFVRDHSISMSSLASGAAKDYNSNVEAIREAAERHQLDTIVSTVKCGVEGPPRDGWRRGYVEREVVNSSVHMLQPITPRDYDTNGGSTPLFDSIGELIEIMKAVPDVDEKDVSFLVIAITDGEENDSTKWTARKLTAEIRKLQGTDRWTFTFRVPRGYGHELRKLGIPEGNILEWEQTAAGLRGSTTRTIDSVGQYFVGRKKGVSSSKSFYADLRGVSTGDLRKNLGNISAQVEEYPVKNAGSEIRTFCEYNVCGDGKYIKGAAFYELTKPETVQDYKMIVVWDKVSGKFYGGVEARTMLQLPDFGEVRLKPGDHGQCDIFVQSTSVNRKLVKGTRLLWWPDAVLTHA